MRIKSFVRALLLLLLTVAATIATPVVHAIPLDYNVSYSGSSVGQAFGGSFTWDSDTSRFSNFIWNLSPTADSLMAANWRSQIFGGTMGQFLFEILSGEDVHRSACSTTSRCTFASVNIRSSLLDSVEFRAMGGGVAEYAFRKGAVVLYGGQLSVSRAVVPVSEPFSLILIGSGLVGIALIRRTSNRRDDSR